MGVIRYVATKVGRALYVVTSAVAMVVHELDR